MRRSHFAAFAPHCAVCGHGGLGLGSLFAEHGEDVISGILLCADPACRFEYPIVDGIPIIVPALRPLLAERGIELLLRGDLAADIESVFGDALGPGSWFDAMRQTVSTYASDGWADLDPAETTDDIEPGAARRCLKRLLELAGHRAAMGARRILDLGCAAGRTCFDLAEAHPDALVLGLDLNLALLRLARGAIGGRVSYSRRRIGLVYDRRGFDVAPAGAERVDFWACDALAPPFASGITDLAAALNLLDAVADPRRLLAGLAAATRPGGTILLASPYDWNARATPMEAWIGGHSQRADHVGAAEPFLRALLTEGAHPQSVPGLLVLGEEPAWPWHTRLHDRASVSYRAHLLALERTRPDSLRT